MPADEERLHKLEESVWRLEERLAVLRLVIYATCGTGLAVVLRSLLLGWHPLP